MSGINVHPEPVDMAHAAAEHVARAAEAAVDDRGRFDFVLSGGSTPRLLYHLLTTTRYRDRIDWSVTRIFFGDERCVPPDDVLSNYMTARHALLDRVPIPPESINRIHAENGPEAAARAYEEVIGTETRFDLLLLGLGTDGHVASLFPGSAALEETERRVVPSESPFPPKDRVTLTLPAINTAREILFLVSGRKKAHSLGWVLRELAGDGPRRLPASRVAPVDGEVYWYADRAATPFLSPGRGR